MADQMSLRCPLVSGRCLKEGCVFWYIGACAFNVTAQSTSETHNEVADVVTELHLVQQELAAIKNRLNNMR